MAANYGGILTLEKVRLNYHGNLPRYCFITLAPGITILIQYEALAMVLSYQTLYQNAPMVILHLNKSTK
jgi:hypothetical protein